MAEKKKVHLCLFWLLILLFLSEKDLAAVDKDVAFDAKQLYIASMGGIRVVRTIKNEKVFFIKSRELSEEQKQHLDRLRSLGYVQSASTSGFDNEPQIRLSGNREKLKKIFIKVLEVKKKFSLRVKVNTEEQEVLFLKEYRWSDLENFLVNQRGEIAVVPIDYDYEGHVYVNLEFESCDLGISEIRFVYEINGKRRPRDVISIHNFSPRSNFVLF
jgi:hypothetical protein